MSINNLIAQAIHAHSSGNLEEAGLLYRKVLATQPRNNIALANLGVIANQTEEYEIAENFLYKALEINPNHAPTLTSLGNALRGLERYSDSVEIYRNAINLMPEYVEAYYNMAMSLIKLELAHEAIPALRKVVSLKPDAYDAYNALGTVLERRGEIEEAIYAYNNAISIKPDFALAHNNLGNAFLSLGMHEQALICYRTALNYKKDFVEALFNLGSLLLELAHEEEAIDILRKVISLKPEMMEAQFTLTRAKKQICDWTESDSHSDAFKSYLYNNLGHVDPFFLLSQNSTHADQLICAQNFAKRFSVPDENVFQHFPKPKNRKIRIGYISGNFQRHPNSYLSVGLFEQHDRKNFDVLGYSYGDDDGSQIRKRVVEAFDSFIDLKSLTHSQAAKRIYDDEIDILIDRQGYTLRHRMGIMAYRPAPIQVNYLGYPGTMGAQYIDYIIVDPFVVPQNQQPFFTEKLVYMPHCYQSTDNRQVISDKLPSRTSYGLPENGFVFCCFNNSNKICPEFFDIWMSLLKQVPGSVLWLLKTSTLVDSNLRSEAMARGVDPARLLFAPKIDHDEHLARQSLADLFLDTLPYNAHTTASDALWAGLPLLTCVGETFAGRVAGSILLTANLPELVTYSPHKYEQMALKLATNPSLLQDIRNKLKKNRTSLPLFDTVRYTRDLEHAYSSMWKLWQTGKKAQSIKVPER